MGIYLALLSVTLISIFKYYLLKTYLQEYENLL